MAITTDPIVRTPNFSIVTPGGCNAKCEFCFWEKMKPSNNYLEKLEETLMKMPTPYFNQISITGGEPTASPVLGDILSLLKTEKVRDKYKKVVLTTNGFKLIDYIDQLKGSINHINISRHSTSEELNKKVFKTDTIPNDKTLLELCNALNNIDIDVTLSTVLTEECFKTKEDILDYIRFAKSMGASAVALRIKHGSIDEHPFEKEFSHIEFNEHNCGVCRHRRQIIEDTIVTWKSSVSEPSNTLNGVIYEAVYNQDGSLTKDWEGKHEILFHP